MTSGYRRCWAARLGLAIAVAFIPAYLQAAGQSRRASRANRAQPAETVEMFQAVKDGRINVKLIPKNSKQSNVLIENKTDKPLAVKLPDAFAGVLAQAGLGLGGAGMGGAAGGFGRAGGGGFGGGGGQALGGGFGGGGLGGGGGFFNVPPEKVGKLRVTTVCLEHGKPEPRPAMKYEIKPIAEFTDKEEVHELCRMLGSGLVDQRSAQAAAWHLSSGMTWQQLVAKQLKFANGMTRSYFHAAEIQRAMQAVSVAAQLAQQRKQADVQDSLSQPQTAPPKSYYGRVGAVLD
ncbi:MAG: hypothetical protein ACYTG0_41470 [Planctomycetota bacterium]|jgi:hypothetical protein